MKRLIITLALLLLVAAPAMAKPGDTGAAKAQGFTVNK